MSSRAPKRVRIPILFGDPASELASSSEATLAAARAAQLRWVAVPLASRRKLLRKFRALLAQEAPRLALAIGAARGRPVAEVLTAEIAPLAEASLFLEREAAGLLRPRRLPAGDRPLWLGGVTTEIHREPFGVVLIIAPANYPLLLPGVQLLQALTAGNAVLLKPGQLGTPAAEALVRLLAHAGFDQRLMPILPESAEAAAAAIAARPDKVLFTGSAAAGEKILAQAALHLTPSTLELSGCDAVIVREDADLELVAKALAFALRLNGGATCIGPRRLFVPASRATELEGRLTEALRDPLAAAEPRGSAPAPSPALRPSNPHWAPLVREALQRGAHLIAGAGFAGGALQTPIVLGGVAPGSALLHADVFAPVLAMVTVGNDGEALRRANDCPFALGASIFSRDTGAARRLASQLRAGVVTINDLILPTADPRVPFGGRGRSGFGVTRGAEGLLALTVPKVVTVTRSRIRPAFERENPGDAPLFCAYLQLAHGEGLGARARALGTMLRLISSRRRSNPHTHP